MHTCDAKAELRGCLARIVRHGGHEVLADDLRHLLRIHVALDSLDGPFDSKYLLLCDTGWGQGLEPIPQTNIKRAEKREMRIRMPTHGEAKVGPTPENQTHAPRGIDRTPSSSDGPSNLIGIGQKKAKREMRICTQAHQPETHANAQHRTYRTPSPSPRRPRAGTLRAPRPAPSTGVSVSTSPSPRSLVCASAPVENTTRAQRVNS